MDLVSEKIYLAPKEVFIKAKELASHGLFESALKILNENKVEVEVYETHVSMKLLAPKKGRDYFFGRRSK